ncbi:MAG: hypothetical protein AMJ43_06735 [Coxiella sp. DG_40]|nr:MAG: hypothetical protein AMJ43_06735 [Coxiella sp. DG_40]
MFSEQQFRSGGYGKIILFVLTIFLGGGYVLAAEQGISSGLERYRVFPLRHISAEQGKQYLAEVGLGTVSQLPGTNTLLVTAQPDELIKASSILGLVDVEQQYVIKAIFPASESGDMPSNEQIAAEVGNIFIGTFFDEPPSHTKKDRAIIDIHEESVIAIAPAEQIEMIVSAVERLQGRASEAEVAAPKEPQVTSGELRDVNESGEFFNKLLDSLAEAEKLEAELARQPAEVNAVTTVPEQEAPSLPSVIEGLEAEEFAQEPGLEPEGEPIPGQVVIEIEQEAEAVEAARKIWSYKPAETIPSGEEMLELDLPERLDIVDLLDLVGKYLHLDYMYDAAKVRGEVTLRLQGRIKIKDLYPLLESVLKFRGFVMSRKGNLVTIVPTAEVLDIDPALLRTEEDKIKLGDVIVTRIFKLQHIDTTSAKNLLVAMKLGEDISEISETGTLIVTSYAYRMARIEEILQMVDKPGEPKQFRFRQLRYTMAATLAPKIKTLAEQIGTVSIDIAAPVAAPAAPPRRRVPTRRPPRVEPTPKAAEPAVYLDADERTNRILMIGYKDELDIVDDLIGALDVEQQDLRTLRLYEIQHVGAEEVRNKLAELGIIGGGVSVARAPGAAKAPAPATPPTAGVVEEPLVEEPQVVIIESTNSLLVNATTEQHIQIATIIGYVDSETMMQAIPYVIYPLENQKPEDMAAVLQQLIQETIKDQEGKIQTVVKRTEEEIVIVPDKNTFSLIVYASKKNQEWISNLIKTLDKRRPQVLIDVTLVEVSRTEDFNYDLDIISAFPDLTAHTALLTDAVLPPNVTGGGRDRFIELLGNSGRGTGFYADKHINLLLTAMQTKGYGRVLAKPKILVNDGQPGTIQTTDRTNVKFEDFISGGPDKPDRTVVRYEPYSAGITLTITPNISEGDLLLLETKLTRSDFGKRVGEAPPDTTESDIETTVTVPDGRTIILGGLLKLNQGKGGTKVPLIGDVPLIGGLFRSTSNEDRESKLYVFVKANILRPDEAVAGLPELHTISGV